MGLEDDFRQRIREAMATDPNSMELWVRGDAAHTEEVFSDTRFLNTVSRVIPAFLDTLEALTQAVDKLNAAAKPGDVASEKT